MEHALEGAVFVMLGKSDLYVVDNRHVLEKPDVLEGSGDSGVVDLDGALTSDVLAVKPDDSFVWLIYACQKVENCGLSGAVRSDKSVELALFDLYVKVVNGAKSAE